MFRPEKKQKGNYEILKNEVVKEDVGFKHIFEINLTKKGINKLINNEIVTITSNNQKTAPFSKILDINDLKILIKNKKMEIKVLSDDYINVIDLKITI